LKVWWLLMAAGGVAACSGFAVVTKAIEAREVPTEHTVSWFLEHPSNMRETWLLCRDDPRDARGNPECINDRTAMRIVK
jgi:hypothetical protein